MTARRALLYVFLVASLGLNVALVAVSADARTELSSRLGLAAEADIDASADRPELPVRAQGLLSMTRRPGGLKGEGFEAWRGSVLARLRALVSLRPVPLSDVESRDVDVSGASYRLTRLTYPSPSSGDRIVAYRLLPRARSSADGRPAVVLAIPGTGAGAVDGLLGRKSDYQRAAAVELARRGYAVYVPESAGIGERAFDAGWLEKRGYHSQHVLGMYGLWSGETLAGIFLSDLQATLKVIEADPEVDGRRIATFGISRGGTLAMLTAALSPSVRGAVVASGLRDSDEYVATYFDHVLIPGQGRYFFDSDIAGTIAPRPLLVTYGRKFEQVGAVYGEANELQEEVRTLRTARRVRAIYGMRGAQTAFRVVVHDRGHTWDEDATTTFLRELFRS